ncbi:MAG TPA: YbaK/EbsC family protein [Thermoanaerobaculia bacterium]|jgi:prolyl-tRNA editing enzyme YbaK/EbsC (Cys-tRNA(Pro) deacylase)
METPQWLKVYRHPAVISCVEAAQARGVPLSVELKTLLMRSGGFVVAVHLAAHRRLNSRAVKRLLGTKRLSFLHEDELVAHGVRRGAINPWNVPFCSLHVVAQSVFRIPRMSTNNSRLDEGVLFATRELRKLPGLIVGPFDCETPDD